MVLRTVPPPGLSVFLCVVAFTYAPIPLSRVNNFTTAVEWRILQPPLITELSDHRLAPLEQQFLIALLRQSAAIVEASLLPLESPQGHAAFLVDFARFSPAVGGFLAALPN